MFWIVYIITCYILAFIIITGGLVHDQIVDNKWLIRDEDPDGDASILVFVFIVCPVLLPIGIFILFMIGIWKGYIKSIKCIANTIVKHKENFINYLKNKELGD